MAAYIAEFLGTMILILLGNGVVANVVLPKTKGNNAGWIVITAGWGVAVFVGASCSAAVSGAHLNPALTLALMTLGRLSTVDAAGYIVAQFAGAIVGAVLVYLFYRQHFAVSESADDKLACFCNTPALPGKGSAFFCEIVGTFVLVFTILQFGAPKVVGLSNSGEPAAIDLGAVGLVPVALLVFGIGMSLGGTSGYAINPARDLGPRIAHFLLPIPGKRDSDWSYSWVPVVGPILGGIVAAGVHWLVQS